MKILIIFENESKNLVKIFAVEVKILHFVLVTVSQRTVAAIHLVTIFLLLIG